MRLSPIASLAGPDDLHERADAYNQKLVYINDLIDDLDRARTWNCSERFECGFFADKARAPLPVAELYERIRVLRAELVSERAEIVRLAEGSVKP